MCSASIIFRKKMHITKNIKTVSHLSARHEKQEWLLVEVYKHVEWNKETNKAIKLCALCDRYENILFYFISYSARHIKFNNPLQPSCRFQVVGIW